MKIIACILIGYLLGSLSPAALISKLKHRNLRENGTGNLGATNTMLVFGKSFGVLVMLFDIIKSFTAIKIAGWIIPETPWVAMAAGLFAVLGHCFPFYLKFKGGKGLAAFGGMILAYKPLLFVFLLTTGVILLLVVNYGVVMPYYVAVVFSGYVAITSESMPVIFLCCVTSVFIMVIHLGNIKKAKKGQDNKVRDCVKNKILKGK